MTHAKEQSDALLSAVEKAASQLEGGLAQKLKKSAEQLVAEAGALAQTCSNLTEQVESFYSTQEHEGQNGGHLLEQLEAVYAEREQEQLTVSNLVEQLEACYADRESAAAE